ncbi:MAG: transketolase C-terminal domain-containing protein [Candidatus Peregrinibacteria bacterium]|nr:transketolase C-terminal domain-containing protein [Candidatus Peregrinibacteria bacterium]
MSTSRPDSASLVGKSFDEVPASLQRIVSSQGKVELVWIGPKEGKKLDVKEMDAYHLAHQILAHLCIQAPTKHKSGHPGGPLSAFTFSYFIRKRRDYRKDQPLRMSAGHLSLLAYGLEWLFGNEGKDKRLASPQAIIDGFRTPDGLPGHAEAGIGTIPFGAGPLGKGVSNALGAAFGLKYLKKDGKVDVLMADGDSQEGQIMEAFRLASHLGVDNLIVHGDFNDIQLSDLPSRTVAADFAALASACGWQVIEVQNGNDPAQVVAALDAADAFVGKGRPIFICYYTTMGNGVPFMEEGSNTGKQNFHGSPLKDDVAAEALKGLPPLEEVMTQYEPHRKGLKGNSWKEIGSLPPLPKIHRTITAEKGSARSEFGSVHLKALMQVDSRIVVLHADLAGSGGFDKVSKELPGRVINVGVAEANMYMMAAGMRQVGLLPVTYTFAAFGTNEARANARLIDINCGHTHCAVMHDCTHAGLSVGEDGETHQERNYLNIPLDRTQIWMPADSNQAAAAAERGLSLIAEGTESVYVFFPRSSHEQLKSPSGEVLYGPSYIFDGHIDLVRGSGDVRDQATIIAVGIPVHDAVIAAESLLAEEKLSIRVLNVSCIRPIDAGTIIQAALETAHLIVVEDHHSEGGLATQVADIIADFQLPCSLRRLGVNHYFPSATDKDLKFFAGLDAESIKDAVQDAVAHEVCGGEDAIVTAIHALSDNRKQSRFRSSIEAYMERIRDEKGYLEKLRQSWKKRACPKDKLPTNEQLRDRL